ncbi:hypothetical protein GUJ93_ZPchr0013g37994 [Zizania palustris]|uniref:Uncharacterized protein n=1 Tax=Zizania palustris TaxID=103762 RepID=A0A8J5WZ13_ZIZPA|nr:hypothetical protein GUJ93_ZPchr0013g37994 [Zizania palustris]
MAAGERRGRIKTGVARAVTRALRGARDLYVRGAKGFGKFIVAANPRAGVVGRPTSRVFGVGGLDNSEQDLRELVRTTQARGDPATGAGGKGAETAARRGAVSLGRIDEDDAIVHPTM